MNQQQKRYTITRLEGIATKHIKTLVKEEQEMLKLYKEANCIFLTEMLANDRELLMNLPVKEGVSLERKFSGYVCDMFDLSDLYDRKKASNPYPAPDLPSYTRVSYPDGSSYHDFNYSNLKDKALACIKELDEAKDTIMIGSSEEALEALKVFSIKFA